MNYILLAGPIIFIVVITVLGIITPGYNNEDNYISELSLKKYGFVQKINFIITGILIAGICISLARNAEVAFAQIGWCLGAVTGTSLALMGVFDTDYGKSKRDLPGKIHDTFYTLSVFTTGAAYLLVGLGYIKNPTILALSWAIAAVNYILWKFSTRSSMKPGISQRIIVFSSMVWFEILATWILL